MSTTPIHFFSEPLTFYDGKIPYIVTELVEEMKRRNCMNIEGFFRLAASENRVVRFIRELEIGYVENWSKIEDIHILASALKRYFRNMSEKDPLLSFDLYDEAMKANQAKDSHLLKEVLSKLYIGNQRVFKYLCRFLYEMQTNQDKNKMSASNLSICFQPNVVIPRVETTENLKDSRDLFEFMILNFEELFQDIEEVYFTRNEVSNYIKPIIKWPQVQSLMRRVQMRQEFNLIPYIPLMNMYPDKNFKRPTRSAPVPSSPPPPPPPPIVGGGRLTHKRSTSRGMGSHMKRSKQDPSSRRVAGMSFSSFMQPMQDSSKVLFNSGCQPTIPSTFAANLIKEAPSPSIRPNQPKKSFEALRRFLEATSKKGEEEN